MTSRLQQEFSFQAGVYKEDAFLMNVYDMSVVMNIETDDIREQNIAAERVSYYLTECLENCIFVNVSEKKVIDKYIAAGFNVCTFPDDPYDQLITVMLLSKLNAIVEGRFTITDVVLTSRLSPGVSYLHDSESPEGPFATKGWWNEPNAAITSPVAPSKKDKVVQFSVKTDEWAEIGLCWKESPILADQIEITFTADLGK